MATTSAVWRMVSVSAMFTSRLGGLAGGGVGDHEEVVTAQVLGGAGCGGRVEDARQMDVQVLDFDLAAAVPECPGKEFGETAGTFPD
jgi:hypothetical protein